jgi:hypothetical protein
LGSLSEFIDTSAEVGSTRITIGQSIVALNGPWKFHIGDNPAWATFSILSVTQE